MGLSSIATLFLISVNVISLFSPMTRKMSRLFWLLNVLKIDSSRLSFSASSLVSFVITGSPLISDVTGEI